MAVGRGDEYPRPTAQLMPCRRAHHRQGSRSPPQLVRVTGVLNAMPRRPKSAACLAAASVPECQTALPRFVPRLTPD
jgi:hypothetical protein